MIGENHEKTPVRLVGAGIRTRDLPNASLVRYHLATSLGSIILESFHNAVLQLDKHVDVVVHFSTENSKGLSVSFYEQLYWKFS